MTLLTPEFLQTKTYSAIKDRLVWGSSVREGVLTGTDFQATQRAAGANMSVDVAQGEAWVFGDDTTRQGYYHVVNDGLVNIATQLGGGTWVDNSSGTFPRVDTIFLQVNDTTDGGRTSDGAVLGVVLGTPTSGATLSNRLGAPSAQLTAMPIADVLVPAGATAVTTANIQSRRARAMGYSVQINGSGNTSGLGSSFQPIPGMSTAIWTSPGQSILCEGVAYVGSSSSGTGAVFAHWTMVDFAGTTVYGLDTPMTGSVLGTGNGPLPVVQRFVPATPGLLTVKMECYSSGGYNGVGIGTSGFSHGTIRVINE